MAAPTAMRDTAFLDEGGVECFGLTTPPLRRDGDDADDIRADALGDGVVPDDLKLGGVGAKATVDSFFRESVGGRCETAAPGRIDRSSSRAKNWNTLDRRDGKSSQRPATRCLSASTEPT